MWNINNILSGKNFANIGDFVYAEAETDKFGKEKIIKYPLNLNVINDGDIIFCKTDYVYELFLILKNVLGNFKLITHESDYPITKEIFEQKPSCIKKWYGININYNHPDLIPIPLGIANNYCKITLKIDDLILVKNQKKMLYINHRVETNLQERLWLYQYFQTNDWCTVKQANLSFEEYKKDLSEHRFMLCPKGNGIDTHRLWECLYADIIPVVEKHINYKNMEDLPILFVDSFKDITLHKLNTYSQNINKEKLNIEYWRKLIKNEWSN